MRADITKIITDDKEYNIVAIMDCILDENKNSVKKFNIEGCVYYKASDVAKLLKITNITNTIEYISRQFSKDDGKEIATKKVIENYNNSRAIHLITIEGVFQMILNGKTKCCKAFKAYLSSGVLAEHYGKGQHGLQHSI